MQRKKMINDNDKYYEFLIEYSSNFDYPILNRIETFTIKDGKHLKIYMHKGIVIDEVAFDLIYSDEPNIYIFKHINEQFNERGYVVYIKSNISKNKVKEFFLNNFDLIELNVVKYINNIFKINEKELLEIMI